MTDLSEVLAALDSDERPLYDWQVRVVERMLASSVGRFMVMLPPGFPSHALLEEVDDAHRT